nr:hypothetical protein [uncultured Devosia sp.]
MITLAWRGRGFWIPILVALGMFTPIIVLRQIDGPAIDYGVGITMGIAALITAISGFWLNRLTPKDEPALHSFWRVPFQYWALPMLVFAVLLGTRTITTAESPPPPPPPSGVQVLSR